MDVWYRPVMAVASRTAEAHTHTEENLAPLEELALSKKAAGHTPDIERGGCLPVLCNGYHMLRSWSEVSEEILYTRAE